MVEQIKWKAEVSFKGSEKEFNSFVEAMNMHKLEVKIEKWPWPFPFPGMPVYQSMTKINNEVMAELLDGTPEMKIKYIDDIRGGIRTPHIHMGNKIHLLNREKFAQYMGELGRVMTSSIGDKATDHVVAMERLSCLDDKVGRIVDKESINRLDTEGRS